CFRRRSDSLWAFMNPIVTALMLFVALAAFAHTMYGRMASLAALRPEVRWDRPLERLWRMTAFALGQRRMVGPAEVVPGLLHVFIFAAFVILALRTVTLFWMGFSESALETLAAPDAPYWVLHPRWQLLWHSYLFLKDIAAALAIIGCAYFIYVR